MRTLLAVLVAVGLLAVAPAASFPNARGQQAPAYDGCEVGGSTHVCRWWINETLTRSGSVSFDMPAFPRTAASVTVILNGVDNGWVYALYRVRDDGERTNIQPVSVRSHPAGASTGSTFVSETHSHLLLAGLHDTFFLRFTPGGGSGGVSPFNSEALVSQGSFEIRYVAEALPEGDVPARPAATMADPQLADFPEDARSPEMDIHAAWLDDARVGDGLFEVHLRLASLERIDHNFSRPPGTPGPGRMVHWNVEFDVLDGRYGVQYNSPEPGTSLFGDTCTFYRLPSRELVAYAPCEMDRANGTITWTLAERSVGSPAAGVAFSRFEAHAIRAVYTAAGPLYYVQEDEAAGDRYPFALGGPAVWSGLNPRLDPPPVAPLAWHQAPFSEENLPDTLQVLGAVAATLTFLFGLLVVRRRRAQTRRLLDDVDAVERAHAGDAHRALLALGQLEERFTQMFRRGDLQEAQYQVVSQRIASVATRFALRRELGLDDGEPGEQAGTRVPVRGPDAASEARP